VEDSFPDSPSGTLAIIFKTGLNWCSYHSLANLFTRYIFPLLRKKKIALEDMQTNFEENDAKILGNQLALAYEGCQGSKNRLFSAMMEVFGNRFYAHGFLGFFRDAIVT